MSQNYKPGTVPAAILYGNQPPAQLPSYEARLVIVPRVGYGMVVPVGGPAPLSGYNAPRYQYIDAVRGVRIGSK